MTGTAQPQEHAPGNENQTPEPPISSDVQRSPSKPLSDKPSVKIDAKTLVLQHYQSISPVDDFNKLRPGIQETLVEAFVADMQHTSTRKSRQQILDFIVEILKILAAFVLALVLIVGSIQAVHAGKSVEGLLQGIGAAVAAIVGAFLVRNVSRLAQRQGPLVSNGPEGS